MSDEKVDVRLLKSLVPLESMKKDNLAALARKVAGELRAEDLGPGREQLAGLDGHGPQALQAARQPFPRPAASR